MRDILPHGGTGLLMEIRKFKKWFRFWRWEVQRKWNSDLNHGGDFSGYVGAAGGWEYRVIKK